MRRTCITCKSEEKPFGSLHGRKAVQVHCGPHKWIQDFCSGREGCGHMEGSPRNLSGGRQILPRERRYSHLGRGVGEKRHFMGHRPFRAGEGRDQIRGRRGSISTGVSSFFLLPGSADAMRHIWQQTKGQGSCAATEVQEVFNQFITFSLSPQ